MSVLVVNAGGVTLELTEVDDGQHVTNQRLVDPWNADDTAPISAFVDDCGDIAAVGHRIVHGGNHRTPVVIDKYVIDDLRDAATFAPVHQQRSLSAIEAAHSIVPGKPHVACFDTAFHHTIPEHVTTYALPADWRRRWPLARVGFHGLSHHHVATAVPHLLDPDRPTARIVSCHLGSGASLCAILHGKSIDTTMGMTPLDGLVMVHRSGSVDPGLIIWLLQHGHLTVDELNNGLNNHSGLGGLAGGTGDMRDIVARRDKDDPNAALAFDVYIHRLRQQIGAMTATLDGLDVLAFTGGVGQHMPIVRAAATDGLEHLGLRIDQGRNEAATSDADITADGATASCVVVTTGEHLTIAAATRAAISANSTSSQV